MKIPGLPQAAVPMPKVDDTFIAMALAEVEGQRTPSIEKQLNDGVRSRLKPELKDHQYHTIPELTPEENDELNGSFGTKRTI